MCYILFLGEFLCLLFIKIFFLFLLKWLFKNSTKVKMHYEINTMIFFQFRDSWSFDLSWLSASMQNL